MDILHITSQSLTDQICTVFKPCSSQEKNSPSFFFENCKVINWLYGLFSVHEIPYEGIGEILVCYVGTAQSGRRWRVLLGGTFKSSKSLERQKEKDYSAEKCASFRETILDSYDIILCEKKAFVMKTNNLRRVLAEDKKFSVHIPVRC